MAIKTSWIDDARTGLHCQFSNHWSQQELDKVIQTDYSQIAKLPHSVSIIIDFSLCNEIQGNEILIWKMMMRMMPDNMRSIIFVATDKQILERINQFIETNKWHRSKIYVCQSFAEASLLIQDTPRHLPQILVIEDEDVLREEIVDNLELHDYRTLDANNGLTGLRLARQHHPDLVITDISMPHMDGFALLNELRRSPITTRIPVIILTAYDDRSFQRHGMELGADDYVTKPFTHKELLSAVKARLIRSKMMRKGH